MEPRERPTAPTSRPAPRPATAIGLTALHAGLAAAAVAGIYLFLTHQARRGGTGAELLMPSMHMGDVGHRRSFYLLQASGDAALIWAWVALALGMLLPQPLPRRSPITRSQLEAVHRQLNLAVIALMGLHLVYSVPGTTTGTWADAFVPQSASFQPWAYTTGVISFYLAILLGPTWYLRRLIGRRVWRLAHQFALLVWIFGTWHTLLLGADFRVHATTRTVLWAAQLPLLALFLYRCRAALRRPVRAGTPPSLRRAWFVALTAAGALGAVIIVVLLLTGETGGTMPARF